MKQYKLNTTPGPWLSINHRDGKTMIPVVVQETTVPVAYVGTVDMPNDINAIAIAVMPSTLSLLIRYYEHSQSTDEPSLSLQEEIAEHIAMLEKQGVISKI